MAVVATGFFDGVHLGHRAVLDRMVTEARNRGTESVVVTFWPHPRNVLQQDADTLRLLNSLSEKRALCLAAGADCFEVLPFSRDFARLTAEGFVREYLRNRFDADTLVLGHDHRLGCDPFPNPEAMAKALRSAGVEPVFVDDCTAPGGRNVSSTLIRRLLAEGKVSDAASLLGYGYPLTGVVVAGAKIGRKIGYPTANMSLYEPLKLIPAGGVYIVRAEVLGRTFRGICNIGHRPTLDDGRGRTIETHLLDFNEDIYGLDITVTFLERLRDEQKFASLKELSLQLAEDEKAARNFDGY
ncbi:MAG: riboflavin biosynthesis protein RibF [Bacteroidales bacterium]|nr:riboflavin biosynthesis protein RibF [Bacteroidales bacterium]